MLLSLRQLFVREHVALIKLTGAYDLIDPLTQQQVGIVRDEPAGWQKWLRLLVNKRFLSTTLNVYEQEGMPPVLTLRKHPGLLRVLVDVESPEHGSLGQFKSKLMTIGGGFFILDMTGQPIGEVSGDWKGWNFQLRDAQGGELGTVTKKWAGVGKELLTNADNYMIALSDAGASSPRQAALLLAAALAIDTVFKEKQG